MVVVMQAGASEEQIQHVIDRLVALGFDIHRSTGASQTVLGAVGVRPDFDTRDVEVLPGVREVVRVTQPYKLASRAFRPEGTVVELPEGVRIGGNEVVVAAGPCAVESAEQINLIAERVAQLGARLLRGGAFKPRSSPYSFQGLGEPGLVLLREAADKNGLLVVSEVMDPSQISLMLPYVDLLQVGARNMQNYHLLRALGQVAKPVLLKRGMSATIEELLLSAEYIMCRREPQRHPVRARHPDVRDLQSQHAGHRGDPGDQEAFAPADSSPTRRTAPAAATRFFRWRAPPWPRAPTACCSKCTTTPSTRFPTARSRCTSTSSRN